MQPYWFHGRRVERETDDLGSDCGKRRTMARAAAEGGAPWNGLPS